VLGVVFETVSEDRMWDVLVEVPLAVINSRFVPTDLTAVISQLMSKATEYDFEELTSCYQSIADDLERYRHILTAFYWEALRMYEQPNCCFFADNVVLEVADIVLRSVPLILAYADESVRANALSATCAASEVRAQISWGIVKDFCSFRVDVIILAGSLCSLEDFFGNDTRQPLPRPWVIDWRSQFLVWQAAQMLV